MVFNPNKRGTFKAVTPSQGRRILITWIVVVIAFVAFLELLIRLFEKSAG